MQAVSPLLLRGDTYGFSLYPLPFTGRGERHLRFLPSGGILLCALPAGGPGNRSRCLGLLRGRMPFQQIQRGPQDQNPSSHYPLAVSFLLIRRDSRPYRLRGSPARSEGGLSSAEERNSSTVSRPPAPGAAKSIFTTCGI